MGGVGISRLVAAKGMGSKGGVGTNMWGGGGCQGLDGVGDGEEGDSRPFAAKETRPSLGPVRKLIKTGEEFRVMVVSHLGSLSQGPRRWQRYLEHEEGEEGGSPALPQPPQIAGVA